VPDAWLSRHTYALGDIKQVINELCAVLEKRSTDSHPARDADQEILAPRRRPRAAANSETANQQSNPSTR